MAGELVQDILILSNGPGEVSTWVRPVVRSLKQLPEVANGQPKKLRISVVLSPCAHAMGTEKRVVESFPEVAGRWFWGAISFSPWFLANALAIEF